MSALFKIAIVLEPNWGGFLVYVPVSDCYVWGETREEALESIREMAGLLLERLIALGKPIPIGDQELHKEGETYIIRVCAEVPTVIVQERKERCAEGGRQRRRVIDLGDFPSKRWEKRKRLDRTEIGKGEGR